MPGPRTLCSVNCEVVKNMAQMVADEARRSVHDVAIFGRDPRQAGKLKAKNRRKKKKKKAAGEDPTTPRAVHIGAKYRRDRPWLSAREVRQRAREDEREKDLTIKHRFGVTATNYGMGKRPARIIEGSHTSVAFSTPRDLRLIKRVKLPKIEKPKVKKPVDFFGPGDLVRLATNPDDFAYGCQQNWQVDMGQEAEVLIGGKRWKGDCLIALAGQRLWVKQAELEMVRRNPEPRPTTKQENDVVRKKLARDRKKRQQAQNMALAKFNKNLTGNATMMDKAEIEFFFEQLDIDGSGQLDVEEVLAN